MSDLRPPPTLSGGRSLPAGRPLSAGARGVRRRPFGRGATRGSTAGRDAAGARRAACLLLGAAVAAGAGGARAQAPPLVTDRPDRTESAAVVPRGLFQVETGYLFTRNGGAASHAAPGALLRIGLGGRTEIRLGHAGLVGGAGGRGAGDGELGAKVNLVSRASGGRPEFALLGGLSLPTGGHGFSIDGVDASFLAAFAHELGPGLSLGYNAGAAWRSSADRTGRAAFILCSLVLGAGLTDRLGTFVEVFGDRQADGAAAFSASADAGLTLLLTDVLQLDVSAGRRLRGPADDRFVGAGLSFRWPR